MSELTKAMKAYREAQAKKHKAKEELARAEYEERMAVVKCMTLVMECARKERSEKNDNHDNP